MHCAEALVLTCALLTLDALQAAETAKTGGSPTPPRSQNFAEAGHLPLHPRKSTAVPKPRNLTAAGDATGTSDTLMSFALVGSLTTPTAPVSAAINGNIAYVCTPNEIVTVDISDPSHPRMLATTTPPIVNNSSLAYCSLQRGALVLFADQAQSSSSAPDSPGFIALNLDDPTNPQLIKVTPIEKSFFEDPIYIGNIAFVPTGGIVTSWGQWASQNGDLISYDLSDFSRPRQLGTLANPEVDDKMGGATMVLGATQAANGLLYLGASTATGGSTNDAIGAAGVGVIQVVDITNPSAMTVLGQLVLPGTTYAEAPIIQNDVGVALARTGSIGNGLWCCDDGTLAIFILDLSNRRNPVVRGFVATNYKPSTGSPWSQGKGAVALGNNLFAFAGLHDQNGADVVVLVDATNPNAPVLTPYPVAAPVSAMVASGNYLYVSAANGFLIYSIPGNSSTVDSCPPSNDVVVIVDPPAATSSDSLVQVRSAAKRLLDELVLPPDRVAIVQAGPAANLLQGLTTNKTAAASAIDAIGPGSGSNLGAAIAAAQMELLGPGRNAAAAHAVVIFSNGQDAAAPSPTSTAQAAATAKAAGIQIYTVGFDNPAATLGALASSSSTAYSTAGATALQQVMVQNSTTATAILKVDPHAVPGPRTCTVATGSQVSALPNALTVQGAPAGSSSGTTNVLTLGSLTPSSGAPGDTISLAWTGSWLSAPTVTLTPTVPGSETLVLAGSPGGNGQSSVTFTIPKTVLPSQPVSYQVALSGGLFRSGVLANSVNSLPLTITPASGITSIVPWGGLQGSSLTVQILVFGVPLSNATIQASFGDGIQVGAGPIGGFGDVVVTDPNTVTASIQIDPAAAVGTRTITLVVNGVQYTSAYAFVVFQYCPNGCIG